MDCVFIDHLEVNCIIGIYEAERNNPQPVIVDCRVYYEDRGAGQDDDYSRALDYDAMAKGIEELLLKSEFQLVEAAAEAICSMIMSGCPARKVWVRVAKPQAVKNAKGAGVEIERSL